MAARGGDRVVTRAIVLAAALALRVATDTASQPPPPAVFRSGIEIVELDVSVTRSGLPVQGLTARDFALTDNGVAQELQSVTLDLLPLSVTLLLDSSASVAGTRLDHLKQASAGVVDALRPDDRAALVTFSHSVNVVVSSTDDKAAVRAALASMRADGATALRDAVQLALSVHVHDRSRPLILIFTDGADTISWLTEDAVLDTARRAGIVVHAVRIDDSPFLNRLAEVSGGRTWSATSDRQLRELFTTALEEMRARYLLTYTPRGAARTGWHELKVRLKNGRADITARPGYFVAAAAPSGSSPQR
jgi:VWFA-related protein